VTPPLFGHPCSAAFRSLDASTLSRRIEEAGIARLVSLAERFAADFTFTHPHQVAYSGLMQAMGFASNREPFRMLAECVPYRWIMPLPAEQRTEVLLDAAGLGPPGRVPPPACLNPDVWRLSRLRPGNHPVRRLLAVSVLLERFKPSLIEALAGLVLEAKKPREICRALTVSASGLPALGAGRADEIAASVVLPLIAAFLPERPEPTLLFSAYPSPPSTRWTRTMTEMMRVGGHELNVRSALQHQGLHATYVAHCRFGKRDGCPLCRGESPEGEREVSFSQPLAG
jgi:hypothetical protein